MAKTVTTLSDLESEIEADAARNAATYDAKAFREKSEREAKRQLELAAMAPDESEDDDLEENDDENE